MSARRRLLLLGLVPLVVALGLGAKVALMLSHDLDGRTALREGSVQQARSEFVANRTLNWFESWVAPYDEGIARYRLGDASGAVLAFSTALDQAPVSQVCRVRINLALAQEALGDAASSTEDRGGARAAWRDGVTALTLDGCLVEDPDDGLTPVVRAARAIETRLREKLAADEQEQQDEADQQDEPEPDDQGREGEQEQASQLQQRNRAGQEQRERQARRQEQRLDDQQQRQTEGPPSSNW